jgi:hypothetical protein
MRTAHKLGLVAHLDLSAAPNDLSAPRNCLWELYERSKACALHNGTTIDEDPHAMSSACQTVSTSLVNGLCLSFEACPTADAQQKLVTFFLGFHQLLYIGRPNQGLIYLIDHRPCRRYRVTFDVHTIIIQVPTFQVLGLGDSSNSDSDHLDD